jgi:hypothetical protein
MCMIVLKSSSDAYNLGLTVSDHSDILSIVSRMYLSVVEHVALRGAVMGPLCLVSKVRSSFPTFVSGPYRLAEFAAFIVAGALTCVIAVPFFRL